MKSPPPETGPPNPQPENGVEADKPPPTKKQAQSETEKDSGYSDSSSESLSSEEPPPSTTISVTAATPDTPQTTYTPIYILQNITLKQPRILLLQPPLRRHRKRASPLSYLPILRSYPRIAPRVAPPRPPQGTAPTPASSVCKQPSPQLLQVSLSSLALLRRTRETQRSIRELKAHTRLYERALQGEEGGWERLRKAMEKSGVYPKIPTPAARTEEEERATTITTNSTPSAEKPQTEKAVTSPEKSVTSSEACDGEAEEAV